MSTIIMMALIIYLIWWDNKTLPANKNKNKYG